ncbi:extensin family protein [Aliiroseovarius crassostreae]|uniref:extensin-like domain-containing protein n=1 Tax=Aliiroseovarius crassostreae TaxID=154981 RepID=UPI0021FAF11D|nr:extensin family protein [Aliiroseovarius crassostreae]UWQ07218.1 extensin family protein [Aliiroseovarius crassostreae]UWQ10327.1 extensin family protein [Aliiroseovarius crassostreae]
MIGRGLGALLLVTAVCGQAALAYAPERSERPLLRPGPPVSAPPAKPQFNVVVRYHADIRPRLRPGTPILGTAIPGTAPPATAPVSAGQPAVIAASPTSPYAVARSPRPQLRPRSLVGQARGATPQKTPAALPQSTGTFGAICGSRRIRGQKVSTISGTLPGCGLRGGVKVSEVSGIRLSTPAVMDCDTAKALDSWVRKGVVPAVGRLGGGPAELKVIAHYACRTRNNKPGGKVSEHGKGRAVDIAGLTLKNGARISVLKGWKDPVQGKVLRAMHASACGPFGTVLGPDADRYHKDHLHLDTARHRSGSYCR